MSFVGESVHLGWRGGLMSFVGESVHRGGRRAWYMSFIEESNLNHVLGTAFFGHRLSRLGGRGLVDVYIAELTLSLFQLTVFIGLKLVERFIVTL